MYQTRQRAFLSQTFEVCAGLAESNAAQGHITQCEFLAYEMVERYVSCYDVASSVARL